MSDFSERRDRMGELAGKAGEEIRIWRFSPRKSHQSFVMCRMLANDLRQMLREYAKDPSDKDMDGFLREILTAKNPNWPHYYGQSRFCSSQTALEELWEAYAALRLLVMSRSDEDEVTQRADSLVEAIQKAVKNVETHDALQNRKKELRLVVYTNDRK